MEGYKKKSLVLYNLCSHVASAFACSMLFYSPTLLPRMVHFFFITIPSLKNEFFNPMCLFVLANVIVIILVGESKFEASRASSGAIYDEYIERKRSLKSEYHGVLEKERRLEDKELVELDHVVIGERKDDGPDEKREEVMNNEKEKEAAAAEEEEVEEGKGGGGGGGGHVDNEDGEDGDGLPVDELNKRVEEFIARVNRQRWIEARSLTVGRG